MNPDAKMKKYIYKGAATALSGNIRKPYFHELGDHLSIETHAGSHGTSEANRKGFAVGEDISYESASTRIEAVEKNGVYLTTSYAQVKGLRMGKFITVDEVTACLHSVYHSREYPKNCYPRVLPAGSDIKGLRIDGKEVELKLPAAFKMKFDDEFFASGRHDDPVYAPVKCPDSIHDPRFGTIHYAEWSWMHPPDVHRHRLVMLRLALGSDLGADVDVSACCSDGVGWPPGN